MAAQRNWACLILMTLTCIVVTGCSSGAPGAAGAPGGGATHGNRGGDVSGGAGAGSNLSGAGSNLSGAGNNVSSQANGGGSGGTHNNVAGGAPGAPISIPDIVIREGEPVAQLKGEIEATIRDKCGGTQCVTVTTTGGPLLCGSRPAIDVNSGAVTVTPPGPLVLFGNPSGNPGDPCPSDQPPPPGGTDGSTSPGDTGQSTSPGGTDQSTSPGDTPAPSGPSDTPSP